MPTNLGFKSQSPTPDMLRMVRAGAKVVTLIDDFGPAKDLLAINPKLILVGRVFSQWNPVKAYQDGLTPEQGLADWLHGAGKQFQTIAANPLIKTWEGPNEPVFGLDHKGFEWYGRFEALRADFMADHGLNVVIGNFSTGVPEIVAPNNMWSYFLEGVRAVKQHPGSFMGLHEYAWPTLDWLTEQDTDGVLRGWLTLRYRRVYQYLATVGLGDTPLLITEAGVDPGAKPYPQAFQKTSAGGAFTDKTLRGIWAEGLQRRAEVDKGYGFDPQPDPDKFYAEQIAWYDRETLKDAYVQGVCVYELGGSWAPFDLAGQPIVTRLESYLVNATVVPEATAPAGATHRVTAGALNVREFPWIGNVTPPSLRLLPNKEYVTVYGTFQTPSMKAGWGLLSPNGNQWVNLTYLEPVTPAKVTSPALEKKPAAKSKEG